MTVPSDNLCTDNPPLTLNCEVTPKNPETGTSVMWEATNVTGGDSSYSYEWSGDVSGTNQTETASYSNSGTKTGMVTVESGNQQRSAQCSVDVTDGGGRDDDGNFNITHNGESMWTVSRITLPSTKTEIDPDKTGGFNQEVTLTASSSRITNTETKFLHDGSTPQETLNLNPDEFNDSIKLFSNSNVPAGTYPVTVTAETPSGMSASAITPLRAQSYMEF